MEEHYLIMVDPTNNHNKFYHLVPTGNGNFQAVYGRVGQTGQICDYYGEAKFKSLLDQKIKKGYRDETDIRTVTPATSDGNAADTSTDILQVLYSASIGMVHHICRNVDVSQTQLGIAREWVTKMSNDVTTMSVQTFNQLLVELFYMIPRPTSSVESLLAQSTDDFSKILTREFNLLNALGANVQTGDGSDAMPDISDNVTVSLCDSDTVEDLKSHMDSWTASHVSRIWSIRSKSQDEALTCWLEERKIKVTKLLGHGTGTENLWPIVSTKLSRNPMSAHITGHMFGHGLYFAPKLRKAAGYTSLHGSYWRGGRSPVGYILLFEVAYGNPLHVDSYKTEYYEYPKRFPRGHYCLHAHAGRMLRNDEIVVYDEDACAIRYLVELR